MRIPQTLLLVAFMATLTLQLYQGQENRFQPKCNKSSTTPCPSKCSEDLYRRIDGCCNNLNNTDFGSAKIAFERFLPAVYDDNDGPRGGLTSSSLPSARAVSNAVHRTRQIAGNKGASLMVMQFGQFLDHDITLTPHFPDSHCCNKSSELNGCFNINSGMDPLDCLPFARSTAFCNQDGKREQINNLTAYIDGSNIYGSELSVSEELRSKRGGELRMNDIGPTLPTREEAGLESGDGQHPEDLVAGDSRAIEQPGLASMHSLFLNEHNRIARALKEKAPEWKDEDLYQITRNIVAGELQNIVYSEFLPVVLGEKAMVEFNLKLPEDKSGESIYNPNVNATIRNAFATAAFRFGHSLIPNHILPDQSPIRTKSISCPMRENFFKFDEFIYGSDLSGKAWQNMIKGMTNQESPSMDISINRNVLDFLFCGSKCAIPGGVGQDLAARNIQRGRDHGLPSYTKYREFCNLTALTDWASKPAEISQQDWNNFKKVYSNVGDIDLFVGGLAEVGSDDGLVGPTFGCIIGTQFEFLMKGDRFFFTHKSAGTLNEKGLPIRTKESIRARTLGDIICDNTDASETARNVMKVTPNDAISCSTRVGLDYDAIVEELRPKHVPGNTLIFLGPGDYTSGQSEVFFTPISEKKDLTTQTCTVPPYPITDIRLPVGFVYENFLHICGGQSNGDRVKACFSLINSTWSKTTPMLTARDSAAAVRMQNGSVLVAGGYSSSGLQTSELFTGSTWTPSIQLPNKIYGHCMLQLSTGEIFMHGGWSAYPVSDTHISKDHANWEKVMSSKHKWAWHACTEVIINSKQQVWIGRDINTEIFHLVDGTWTWKDGPELPNDCYHSKFVSYNGTLFYVCGEDKNIYQLKDNWQTQQDPWTEIGEMSEKRRSFPALLITEDVCTGVKPTPPTTNTATTTTPSTPLLNTAAITPFPG